MKIISAAHIFSVNNPKWSRLRTNLSPVFTSSKLRGMFQTLVDCGTSLEQVLNGYSSKECVDIKNVLGKAVYLFIQIYKFKNTITDIIKFLLKN